MEDVGVKELQEKIDEWHSLREQIKDLEDQIKALNTALTPKTLALIKIMEAMELTRFEGTKGKVNLLTIDYVNNPQTEDDKQAFYGYLKDEGIFEEMVSVHHGKLNSFFKDRLEKAVEAGEELHIPGLEVKQRQELRKGR